jgi:hypothetical protein
MPRTIEYRAEGAHVDFTGIVTGVDLFSVNDDVFGHVYPGGRPRYALLDFSGAERIDVSAMDVHEVAEQDQREAERIAGVAVVIVAPQTLTFGLARMWEGLVDPMDLDSGVVRSRPEAIRWLAERGIEVD